MAAPVIGAKVLDVANAVAATTIVGTFLAAVAVGEGVVCCVGFSGAAGITISTVVDTKGNTWTVRTTKGTGSGTGNYSAILDCTSLTAAVTTSDTLTVTLSASVTYHAMLAFKWTGIVGFDVAAAGGTSTSATPSSGALTTTHAPAVVIGCSMSATATRTPDSGQTQQASNAPTSHTFTYNTQPAPTTGSYTDSGNTGIAVLWTDSAAAYYGSVPSNTSNSSVVVSQAISRAATR